MLIQFKVRNYKTFKDEAILSFTASNYDKKIREDINVHNDLTFNQRLLKSAVVFGANASGKTNLLEAYGFMRHLVTTFTNDSNIDEEIPVTPFKLNPYSVEDSTEFEIVFLHNQTQFRYGFEVDKKRVISEWLYRKQIRKEVELFYRDSQDFDIHPREFKKGKSVVNQDMVRENVLLVPLVAKFNEKPALDVIKWFQNTHVLSGIRHESYQGFSMGKCEEKKYKETVLNFMKEADFSISSLRIERLDPENIPPEISDTVKKMINEKINSGQNTEFYLDTLTTHTVYDNKGEKVAETEFSMEEEESNGTRKFFALSGPIIDSLEHGTLLVIDELDSRLHPNLVEKIVSLYNSNETNPKGAQLLFNTHDTNLLVSRLFRRDQVWFTSKDKYGVASLYSLSDIKGSQIRNDEDYRTNYLRGKYGATPFLGDFQTIKKHFNEEER